MNPNYKDFGPRLGFAYSIDPKTVIRAGYGISYAFFNRPGSAMEGINGPLAIFGTFNNTVLRGTPGFLTTQTAFSAGISSNFNPLISNDDYIPANSPLALRSVVGLFHSTRDRQGHCVRTGLQRQPQLESADPRRL